MRFLLPGGLASLWFFIFNYAQARNNRQRTRQCCLLCRSLLRRWERPQPGRLLHHSWQCDGRLVYQNCVYHGAIPGETEVDHLRLNRNGLTLKTILLWLGGEPKKSESPPGKFAWPPSLSLSETKSIPRNSTLHRRRPRHRPFSRRPPSTLASHHPRRRLVPPLANLCAVQWSTLFLNISWKSCSRAQTATRATRRRRYDCRCFVLRQESRPPNPVTATPVAIRHLKKKGKIQSAKTKHLKPFPLF